MFDNSVQDTESLPLPLPCPDLWVLVRKEGALLECCAATDCVSNDPLTKLTNRSNFTSPSEAATNSTVTLLTYLTLK